MTSRWCSLRQDNLKLLFQFDQELEPIQRRMFMILSNTSYLAFLIFAQQLFAEHQQYARLALVVKGLQVVSENTPDHNVRDFQSGE